MSRTWLFPGWHSPWWWLTTVAIVAAIALIVVLMRYERRLVPRHVGVALLALRVSVLGVLFCVFLQPTLAWVVDREKTGRVVVAVDLSESASTADAHAEAVEKLRWARALEMIGDADSNGRLDRWITELEAGKRMRDLTWVDPDETADPDRRAELERARKENVKDVFAEIDRLPRKEIALRLLTQTSQPLLDALGEVAEVDLVVFAGKQESADRETLPGFVDEPPRSLLRGVSDLRRALPAESLEDEAIKTLGVVVFSDGRDNGGGDPASTASRLGLVDVPVLPVMLGSLRKPKDLAVAELDYPERVSQDERATVSAVLNTAGFEGEEIAVVLEREGEPPVTRTVVVDAETERVEFDLDTGEVERIEYVVRTDPRPDETRDDNNERSFAVNVVDDRVNVFLVEGEARWEFRFLHNALERDERVELERVVYRQPYIGVLPDTFWPRRLELPADAGDLEQSPFAEPDVVIVGDVSPTELPETGWQLLEKFVAEAGGTLVLVAGKNHMPRAFGSETVRSLVPVTNLRAVNVTGANALGPPTERGFRLRLSPEGQAEEFLRFERDPDANRRAWDALPGHLWGLVGEAKPAATVLAHALPRGDEFDLAEERRNALVVHQHYGNGQVLWIGVDSTWRWRHRAGDRYHHRFWGQMVRWAAENKAAARNDSVQLVLPRGDVEVGEDAVISARWVKRFLERDPDLKAQAELLAIDETGAERPFQTIDLVPRPDRPLVHEGRAVSLPAGRYVVRLKVENAEAALGELEAPLYVHEKQTLELSDLTANETLLREVADASGGRLFHPDEVHEIPGLFRAPDLDVSKREELQVWDHWAVMLLFFALLTTEWVVRKLHGLP